MSGPESGAQNERTALAWQRTALSLLAGSVVLARLTYDRLGLFSLFSVLVALPLALWVLTESRDRYRHHAGIRLRAHSRGGRAPAALALAIIVMGTTEFAALAQK